MHCDFVMTVYNIDENLTPVLLSAMRTCFKCFMSHLLVVIIVLVSTELVLVVVSVFVSLHLVLTTTLITTDLTLAHTKCGLVKLQCASTCSERTRQHVGC